MVLKDILIILSRVSVTIDEFGLVDIVIDYLQVVVPTNNYKSIADFHTTNHSTLSFLGLFPLVFKCYKFSTMAIPPQTFPGNEC
jgi:hypothetical protein